VYGLLFPFPVASTLPFCDFSCSNQRKTLFHRELLEEQLLPKSEAILEKMPRRSLAPAVVPKIRAKIRILKDVRQSQNVNIHALFHDAKGVEEKEDAQLLNHFGPGLNPKEEKRGVQVNTLDESSRPTGNAGTIYTISLMNLPRGKAGALFPQKKLEPIFLHEMTE